MGTAKMSYPSLAPYIMKRPWLMRWMRPLSEWYFDNAGYRKLGLRADDLVFRMRRAFQCSLSHQLLPKTEWTKTNDDYPYLSPIIREITAEQTEREDLESMIINKRKATPKGSSPNIESKH